MKTDNTYADTLIYNDALNYKIENNEITITGCATDSIVLDIPNEINGTPVTKLLLKPNT